MKAVIAIISGLLVIAGGGPSSGFVYEDEVRSVVVHPVSPSFFCIGCNTCSSGHPGHTTDQDALDPSYGGGDHDDVCLPGTCDAAHGVCCCEDSDGFDIEDAVSQVGLLQRALLTNDARELRELIRAEGSIVRYDAGRGAIQVVNCAEAPVATFPAFTGFSLAEQ